MRIFYLTLFTLLLTASKHPLEIVGAGDIIEVTGQPYGCTLEQFQAGDSACTENDIQGDYNAHYVAVPKPGWIFSHWDGPCLKESVAPSCLERSQAAWVAFWDAEFSDVPIPATVAVFEEAPQGTISGNISFDFVPTNTSGRGLNYNNIQEIPARGVTVQIVTASGGGVLGAGSTDSSGHYAIPITWPSQSVRVRARAEMAREGEPGWQFRVTDNTNNLGLYVIQSDSFTSSANVERSLHAASGWGGNSYTSTRSAAPFALLDTVYKATQLILAADRTLVFPDLEIRWSENNSTATAGGTTVGDIGTSYYGTGEDVTEEPSLYILGKADDDTDEYDSVVGHELGHYIEGKLSRSDSLGGSHGDGDVLDIRLAFSEAWGTVFGAIVSGSSVYSDTNGPAQRLGWSLNLESPRVRDAGWWHEDGIIGLLYDIFDDNNEGQDTLSTGFTPIYEVMVNGQRNTEAMISIFSFLDELIIAKPSQENRIQSIARSFGIDGDPVDSYGTTETNRPNGDLTGASSVLPIYKTLTPDGTSQEACSIIDFDPFKDGNKAGILRLFVVDIVGNGNYRFNASRTSGKLNSDPDMYLYQRGDVIATGESAVRNSETMTASNLSTGRYILEVYEYVNIQPEQGNPENVCFDVSVSQI